MSDPTSPNLDQKQMATIGLQLKVSSKNVDAMPYLKADMFQISRMGSEFPIVVHQTNYQHIVDEIQAGKTEVSENATIAVGKFVLNEEGFMRLKLQVDEIYLKWQQQVSPNPVQ